MKDLGNWALDNRKLIYFLVAVLTIGGVFAYYDMSKLEDPEIKVKQAAVVTVYPGASAHQVELEVTDVLEKSIRSMKDIGEVTSRSMNDMSLINVSLSTLVTNEETDSAGILLRRKDGRRTGGAARRSLRIRGNGTISATYSACSTP